MAGNMDTPFHRLRSRLFNRQADREQPDTASRDNVETTLSNAALSEQALNSLHETLDFNGLMERFCHQLENQLAYDGFEYSSPRDFLHFNEGEKQAHQCHYRLQRDDRYFGEITISREFAFSESEISLIEGLVAGLMLPLQNAIKYEQALRQVQDDALTGLKKSRYYFDAAPLELARARRYNLPFSLLIVDLDDFNAIGQTFGAGAADALLAEIARRLQKEARACDILIRYGRDCFLVLLPQTGINDANLAAERIRQAIGFSFLYEKRIIAFSLCIGVVAATRKDSANALLQRADKALFHAKILGKNQVHAEHDNDTDNDTRSNPAATTPCVPRTTINPFIIKEEH
ncbi:MAG TPA: GGDEF domain-containing protein [Thiotrichales bacterium]|nr:GGDEF domain-containing protein [Thiotrichales bacterium]